MFNIEMMLGEKCRTEKESFQKEMNPTGRSQWWNVVKGSSSSGVMFRDMDAVVKL